MEEWGDEGKVGGRDLFVLLFLCAFYSASIRLFSPIGKNATEACVRMSDMLTSFHSASRAWAYVCYWIRGWTCPIPTEFGAVVEHQNRAKAVRIGYAQDWAVCKNISRNPETDRNTTLIAHTLSITANPASM